MPSAGAIAIFSLTVGAAAFVQSVTGFGFALLLAPVTAALLGPRVAIGLVTVMGTIIPAEATWSQRRFIQRRSLTRILTAAALGTPFGLLALTRLPAEAIRVLISLVVLGAVGILWRRPHLEHLGPGVEWGAGVVAGALATSTGTNGPPLVLALQARGYGPRRFRATISAAFVGINLAVLVVLILAGEMAWDVLPMGLIALPVLVVAQWVGGHVRRRLPAERFRQVVLLLLSVSAVVSGVTALL
jgi:uncharacterized membrane protein YfcA